MWTRRDMLRQTGAAAVLATTTPWWMIRRAHGARQHKLVVWNPAALAPQVDKIMEEQCYAYAKQAGIKDHEIDYSTIGSAQILPKLVASLEAGNPPDITRLGSGAVQFYRVPGHLLEVTDLVENMQKVEGGLFQASLDTVMHEGKAYGVPQSVSPRSLITRLDILEAAKVEPPKTWEALVEVCKKLQKPPKLTGLGMCLGLYSDASNDIMNVIWSYGGQLIGADKKTVVLNSPETVAAVKFIADMYNTHKIIPKGAIGWDNTGNNKAFQSKQVIFVLNSTSIYAHLDQSDKELARRDRTASRAGWPGRCGGCGLHHGMAPVQKESVPGAGQRTRRCTGWIPRTCVSRSKRAVGAGARRTRACTRPIFGSGRYLSTGSVCSSVGANSPTPAP